MATKDGHGVHPLYPAVDHIECGNQSGSCQIVCYALNDVKGNLPHDCFEALRQAEAWSELMGKWQSSCHGAIFPLTLMANAVLPGGHGCLQARSDGERGAAHACRQGRVRAVRSTATASGTPATATFYLTRTSSTARGSTPTTASTGWMPAGARPTRFDATLGQGRDIRSPNQP